MTRRFLERVYLAPAAAWRRLAAFLVVPLLGISAAQAQTISQAGFIEARGFGFPQEAPNDATRVIGDVLLREEVFVRAGGWLQLAAGLDLRANSHDQVEDGWELDFRDRGVRRPRAAVRRLAASITAGPLTVDVGKQFIRWGRADVIYPTDRFAPRDFLNVIDAEILPVLGARTSVQIGDETFEAVWVPRLTPSRLPLAEQRWASVPADSTSLTVVDAGSRIPRGAQFGARWRHVSSRVEAAVSFFDGFNHLPDIDLQLRPESAAVEFTRLFPTIRMYGGDLAIPTGWLTLKGEVALVTSPPETSDEYVLYVVEIERQIGEWLLDVGYAGEVVREERAPFEFDPYRSMAQSIIGRVSYTVDPRRTVAIEGAARRDGDGFYGKLDYSQAIGAHWRLTLTGVGLAGDRDDFLGQYRRNSHGSLALRFSF